VRNWNGKPMYGDDAVPRAHFALRALTPVPWPRLDTVPGNAGYDRHIAHMLPSVRKVKCRIRNRPSRTLAFYNHCA
jgi:hypothetical protein